MDEGAYSAHPWSLPDIMQVYRWSEQVDLVGATRAFSANPMTWLERDLNFLLRGLYIGASWQLRPLDMVTSLRSKAQSLGCGQTEALIGFCVWVCATGCDRCVFWMFGILWQNVQSPKVHPHGTRRVLGFRTICLRRFPIIFNIEGTFIFSVRFIDVWISDFESLGGWVGKEAGRFDFFIGWKVLVRVCLIIYCRLVCVYS